MYSQTSLIICSTGIDLSDMLSEVVVDGTESSKFFSSVLVFADGFPEKEKKLHLSSRGMGLI